MKKIYLVFCACLIAFACSDDDQPLDMDGDGVFSNIDVDDTDPCVPSQASGYNAFDSENTIWAAADCDSDGNSNGAEVTAGTDPYAAPVDLDGDGVNSDTDPDDTDPCLPAQVAGYTGFDANNAIWGAADCDSDGITNGNELTASTDPYDPVIDMDGDGVSEDTDPDDNDPCLPMQAAGYTDFDATNMTWAAADCDSDGKTNGDEATAGSDPYEAAVDLDGDGVDSDTDPDDNAPCVPEQAEDYEGFDVTNAIWSAADCDNDGRTNGEEVAGGFNPYAAPVDLDGDGVDSDTEGASDNDPCFPVQSAGYTGFDATNEIWAGADCDNDGVTNGDEVAAGTDPYDVRGGDCDNVAQTSIWTGSLTATEVVDGSEFTTGVVGIPRCGELMIDGDFLGICSIRPSSIMTFTPDSPTATTGTVSIASQNYNCFDGVNVTIEATGTYDESTSTIVFDYIETEDGSPFTGTVTLTPSE